MTDLEFGTIDADKAIAAIIRHESKLDERQEAFFQCAVLYTSASGQRRVRCHNIAVPVSSKLGDVFRLADMDATIALVAKEGVRYGSVDDRESRLTRPAAITQTLSKTLRDVREILTDYCVKVLLSYRKHCASATSAGQVCFASCRSQYEIDHFLPAHITRIIQAVSALCIGTDENKSVKR